MSDTQPSGIQPHSHTAAECPRSSGTTDRVRLVLTSERLNWLFASHFITSGSSKCCLCVTLTVPQTADGILKPLCRSLIPVHARGSLGDPLKDYKALVSGCFHASAFKQLLGKGCLRI